MMIGVHTTILPQFGRGFSRYRTPDGLPLVLVIDPERDLYGIDASGSLLSYRTPDGTLPALVLDFETENYGAAL